MTLLGPAACGVDKEESRVTMRRFSLLLKILGYITFYYRNLPDVSIRITIVDIERC